MHSDNFSLQLSCHMCHEKREMTDGPTTTDNNHDDKLYHFGAQCGVHF